MWNSEHINSYRINRKMVYSPNTYFFEVKKCARYAQRQVVNVAGVTIPYQKDFTAKSR